MKKILKYVWGTLLGTFIIGTTAFAAEYTVIDYNDVLYTNEFAAMYSDADVNTMVIPPELIQDGIPIVVTGITSNGFFRADVGAGVPFFFNGNGIIVPGLEIEATTPTETEAVAPVEEQTPIIKNYNKKFIFSGQDLNGQTVTQEIANNAKIILLNIWEPWCGPCISELDDLQALYTKYKDNGLLIIGAFQDYDLASAKSLVDTYGITYPIVWDCEYDLTTFHTDYVPTSWFLDANGNPLSGELIGSKNFATWENLYLSYAK